MWRSRTVFVRLCWTTSVEPQLVCISSHAAVVTIRGADDGQGKGEAGRKRNAKIQKKNENVRFQRPILSVVRDSTQASKMRTAACLVVALAAVAAACGEDHVVRPTPATTHFGGCVIPRRGVRTTSLFFKRLFLFLRAIPSDSRSHRPNTQHPTPNPPPAKPRAIYPEPRIILYVPSL